MTENATLYRIRPVRPSDAAALVAFYAALSPESRRLRFLGCATGIDQGQARKFCDTGHDCREGFVAVVNRRVVGHLCLAPAGDATSELAIAVADGFQRRGIGHALFAQALDWARGHGTRRIVATAYAWNAPVLRLLGSAPLGSSASMGDAGVVSVNIPINMDTAGPALAA